MRSLSRGFASTLMASMVAACVERSLSEGESETGGVAQPQPVRVIAFQQQTCAILDQTRLKCWGRNFHGGLGMGIAGAIGDDEHPSVLPGVEFASAIVDVSFHGAHGCVLEASGAVHCWGSTFQGILGFAWDDEDVGDDETLLAGPALELGDAVVQVVTGTYFTCVVHADGGVRCWGDGEVGQTGYASTETIDLVADGLTPASLPLVDVGAPVRALSAGRRSTCAVLEGGQVKCWGFDMFGSLGQGVDWPEQFFIIGDDEVPADYPPIELPGAPVRAVSHEDGLVCTLHEDGAITCWGTNSAALGYGAARAAVGEGYGDDESPNVLGHVDVGGPAQAVEVGYNFGCALLQAGEVRCWGTSPVGQLGRGDFEPVGDSNPPAAYAPIELGGPAVSLTVGVDHACAVLESGDVRCWGSAAFGEVGSATNENIGDDETPASMPPVQIE